MHKFFLGIRLLLVLIAMISIDGHAEIDLLGSRVYLKKTKNLKEDKWMGIECLARNEFQECHLAKFVTFDKGTQVNLVRPFTFNPTQLNNDLKSLKKYWKGWKSHDFEISGGFFLYGMLFPPLWLLLPATLIVDLNIYWVNDIVQTKKLKRMLNTMIDINQSDISIKKNDWEVLLTVLELSSRKCITCYDEYSP